MKNHFFSKKEFNKKKLTFYFILNVLALFLFIGNVFFLPKKGTGIYLLIIVLILFYFACMYLLFEFIVTIPNSSEPLRNICLGSGFILCLILLTYANLYYQVYKLKGEKAFNFSGDSLSGNDFLYYSITTFTTTGYGDITSIGLISNSLAASEMIVGMITNTVLMAIITAKLISKLSKQQS